MHRTTSILFFLFPLFFGSSVTALELGERVPSGRWPAIVLLEHAPKSGAPSDGWCTGTFITDWCVLTSAKCLAVEMRGGPPSEIRFRRNARTFPGRKIILNGKIGMGASEGAEDVAVVFFGSVAERPAPAVMSLGSSSPPPGETVRVIGFGRERVKREGLLTIQARGWHGKSLVVWNLHPPLPEEGDWGGPMIYRNQIQGTLHGRNITGEPWMWRWTAVAAEPSRSHLRAALASPECTLGTLGEKGIALLPYDLSRSLVSVIPEMRFPTNCLDVLVNGAKSGRCCTSPQRGRDCEVEVKAGDEIEILSTPNSVAVSSQLSVPPTFFHRAETPEGESIVPVKTDGIDGHYHFTNYSDADTVHNIHVTYNLSVLDTPRTPSNRPLLPSLKNGK